MKSTHLLHTGPIGQYSSSETVCVTTRKLETITLYQNILFSFSLKWRYTLFAILWSKPFTKRVFPIAYHKWPLLSKKKKIRCFQKCKVHCCNFKGVKVTSLRSLATPEFEPTPPAWVKREPFVTHTGGVGANPRVAKLWRLVTLKSLKLQQCTLYFWKPPVFIFLDKRDQERSCIFSLWYTIANTLRFTL